MKKLVDFNENDEDFSLIDLYPKYVINSKGILKDFDITYIARSINRETGLEFETCEEIAQEVLRKIIGQGLKRVSSTYIREIVCLELTTRGLEKFRNIYARYINISMTKFSLDEDFIEKFKEIQPKWGPLGYITYKRTYARYIEKENRKEEFWETLKRVVEGCFSIQKEHCVKLGLPWSEDKAQKSAQIMYQKMWDFKFIAPGRGLWIMGTPFIDRHGSMALNNCGFASTEDIDIKGTIPFEWTMDALMLGVGVGFDTKGAGKIIIKKPKEDDFLFRIPDSREGWVEALKYTLEAYFFEKTIPKLDYSLIRPAGELIRGFGGIASGPEPLEKMIKNIKDLLDQRLGDKLRSIDIVDIMNFIGKCVVAGNVRRSAEIALGDINDTEFITMKQDKEKLTSHRWASNNSIFAKIGMDYSFVAEQIAKNGEPGVLWLENSRAYSRMAEPPDYKDKKVAGVNPCGEQSLESYELCVRGDTRIHTIDGCYKIKDLKDKVVKLWNGKEWSTTTVQMTSPSAELVRVHFSDGSYLDTTKYHEFHALGKTKRKPAKKRAEELKIGDKMPEWNLGEIKCSTEPYAYEYGLMIGDGYIDKGKYYERPMLILYDSKKELLEAKIAGKWYKEQTSPIHKKPYARVNMKEVLNLEKCKMLRKNDGLEDWVFEMSKKSILEFIAGWIDSDGNVQKNPNTENYRIFGSEKNIKDLQILLRRVGINHMSIRLMKKKGEKIEISGKKTIRKKDIWVCLIPSYECEEIPTRIKKINPKKIGSRYGINNAHPNGKMIDRARKQKIIKIEYLNIKEPVYCFNEPKRHMGVFGNILTYQCCLVETFPSNHESYEEFQDTLKYAYLYAKSVTILNTHWKQTNAIMGKNRRIGTSQSGIINAFIKQGRREIFKWCEKGYKYLKELDSKYSDWLTTPKSIKMTSIKPSGTVSLLPGVTPGIHYPHSEYYIRRIRFNENSDLLPFLREAGYEIHTDKYSPNTSVVEFPIHEEYFESAKKDVSMWEQLENAAAYQKYWADNQVSITVTFKEKEAKDIKVALEIFEDKLKGVTFLPLNEHGYEQAPYEEITQEQYHEMKSKLKPLNLSTVKSEALGERFCDADFCEIKFK